MSKRSPLANLHAHAPVVLPSLLMCDFGNLAAEIEALESAGARGLHLDVMDGHFVPNLSYGMPIVAACRAATDLPLDVHLMISAPGDYLEAFLRAGADSLTIHCEAVEDPRPLLDRIRQLGATAGLAINPTTPVATIEPYLDACDLVLVMSVMPGFGGQAFDEVALEKLRYLRSAAKTAVPLEIDGGVGDETIAACAEAGADLFVVGSALFRHHDYAQRISELTRLARSV